MSSCVFVSAGISKGSRDRGDTAQSCWHCCQLSITRTRIHRGSHDTATRLVTIQPTVSTVRSLLYSSKLKLVTAQPIKFVPLLFVNFRKNCIWKKQGRDTVSMKTWSVKWKIYFSNSCFVAKFAVSLVNTWDKAQKQWSNNLTSRRLPRHWALPVAASAAEESLPRPLTNNRKYCHIWFKLISHHINQAHYSILALIKLIVQIR